VLQYLSALCFYVAASFMPMANVTTLYSTAPQRWIHAMEAAGGLVSRGPADRHRPACLAF
jgi:hypothetical protein